jgi:threonine dehydrogenase-like Zn-dependent dehydrogenase
MNTSKPLQVSYAGICGSDLQKISEKLVSEPRKLGHEIVAFRDGRYLAVNPLISCNQCAECKQERPMFCERLIAIGRNAPGGFSGQISAPDENLVAVGLPNPELAVLGDPYAVVIHGLRGIPETAELTVLGDGIIAQLCVLYVLFNQAGVSQVSVVCKTPERSNAMQAKFGALFEKEGRKLLCETFETFAGSQSKTALILETVGRRQPDTLTAAISHVAERGLIIGFGVFPEGYEPALPIRQLLYKEAAIRGTNSYTKPDFQVALSQIENHSEIFSLLIGKIYPASDLESAFKDASQKTDGLPLKIVVSMESDGDA